MKRALVIAPQWIGDAVMSQPMLAALAERGYSVSVAALPWVAPAYRAMPAAAEVISLPFAHGRLDLMARYRLGQTWRGRYDLALILPNSIKAVLLPLFAGIATRVGYSGESRRLLLTDCLPSPAGRPPMVAFYRALAARALGEPGDVPATAAARAAAPVLRVPSTQVEAVLARHGLVRNQFWVFAPGAEYGPAKCWPAEHYAALAALLSRAVAAQPDTATATTTGLPLVLLGSPKEAQLTAGIAAAASQAGADCRDLAGQTSLDDAIALISAARGLVSNDSGLMHIGAALGVPQVAVFGSTSPEHTPPLNPHARVLWLKAELQLDCAPCFQRTCRFGHLRCLTGIAPERVQAALLSAVAERA